MTDEEIKGHFVDVRRVQREPDDWGANTQDCRGDPVQN